jgi:hypothetical protein
MRVHPVIYYFFKSFIRLVLVVIFVGVPAAAYYLRVQGIGFGAKEALQAALSSPQIEVQIGKLALDPFNGLLARNVVVRETKTPQRTLGMLDNLAISINLSQLMHRALVIDRVSLFNASASIPLSDSDPSARLKIEDIHGEIVIFGDRLRLSLLEGVVAGIQIKISGEILNHLSFNLAPSAGSPDKQDPLAALNSITRALGELKFPNGPPILTAEFEVDALHPESLHLPDFRLSSSRIIHKKGTLEGMEIKGEFTNRILRLPIIQLKDKQGTLQASCEWDLHKSKAVASLISTLNPTTFLHGSMPSSTAIQKLEFTEPPRIDAEIEIQFGSQKPQFYVTGSFASPMVLFDHVGFTDVGCSFAWKDGIFYARDILVKTQRGALEGNLWIAKDDLRLVLHNTIPPTDLTALVGPKARDVLASTEFTENPDITVSLRSTNLEFANMLGKGHLKLGRTAMRGAWMDSVESDFEIANACATFTNILVASGDGRATGSVAYDVGKQEVRLDKIRSTLVPVDVMTWIDPRIAKTITPYRFHTPPSLAVQGKVHMNDPTKNNLGIQVDAPTGLDYDLLNKTLSFGHTKAKVDILNNRVVADVKRGDLMGGNVAVLANVSINPKDPVFNANITLSRLNFSKLTEKYFGYDDSKGVISGQFQFNARMKEESQMIGKGSLKIEDGNVFAIPLLGPFSYILGTVIPGVVYNNARIATADFTVGNEKVSTKNIEIQGRGFSMYGDGSIQLLTGGLDMSMRINAQGIPGLVFFPVSKLFEYYSNGTMADPKWSPKIIPRIPVFGGGAAKKPEER